MQEMAQEQVDADFSAIPAAPKVPTHKVPTAPTKQAAAPAKTAEDLELEQLMAETGMITA
jgi:hypothetical protein